MGCCKWQEGHSQHVLKTHTWERLTLCTGPATLKAVRRQCISPLSWGHNHELFFPLKISVLPTFLYCWLFATFLKRKGKKGRQREGEGGRQRRERRRKGRSKKERKEGGREEREIYEGRRKEWREGGRKRKWLWQCRLELEVVLWPVLNVDLISFWGIHGRSYKKTCAYGANSVCTGCDII